MKFLKRIIAAFILVSFAAFYLEILGYLLYEIIMADNGAMVLFLIISPIIICCLLGWAIYVVVEWYLG